MMKPAFFPHFSAAIMSIMSIMVLAACVPHENVETGAAAASNNAIDSAPETESAPSREQMIAAAPAGPAPRPPAPPMPDPKRLLGLDPAVTMRLLGEPTWRRLDGHTQVYSFISKACRANIYFMRTDDAAPFLLNHADFLPSNPDHDALSEASCLASFFPPNDIPLILLKEAQAKETSLQ